MSNQKHIGRFVQIDQHLMPKWGLTKMILEMDEEKLEQQLAYKPQDRNILEISRRRHSITQHKQELSNYNHLFN